MKLKLRIPRDHPKTPELLRLAEELSSRRRLASGIEVQGLRIPQAGRRFVIALREVLGDDAPLELAALLQVGELMSSDPGQMQALTALALGLAKGKQGPQQALSALQGKGL